MEIRRVQITGGSSYIVTLPKDWIKSTNIKKNDPLGMIIQSDGNLLISPRITETQTQKIKEFNVNDKIDEKFLFRQLIGAYIAGYNSIKIKSQGRIPTKISSIVRKFTQITIGQEVIEETNSAIILKDLLNPIEMPFKSTIKRMSIIVKNMHEDTMHALKTNDKSLAEEILLRDNDVDRLHWLVARQYNIIMQNVSLAEKMGITINITSTYFLISRIIERVGDHVIKLAKNILNIINNNLDEKLLDNIQSASSLSLEIFNKSLGSFFKKDIHNSNVNIELVNKLEYLCEKINVQAIDRKGTIAISIGYIVESIRRIGEYAEDISETTINYLVG